MITSITANTGAPVYVDQQRVGQVWRVLFDCTNGNVLGIALDPKQIVLADAITEWSDALVIAREVAPIKKGSLAARAVAAPIHILTAAAVSQDGTPLGTVSDATVTFPAPQLKSIVVHSDEGERLITRTNIISMEHERIVVRSELAQKVFDWNGATGQALTTNHLYHV